MNKKIFLIFFLLLIVAALALILSMHKDPRCDWRPPKDYIDACPMLGGYYSNGGSGCVSLGACVSANGRDQSETVKAIPFRSGDECMRACVYRI